MRKRVNIFFVALAMSSVIYGMILRYSPTPANVLSEQQMPVVDDQADIFDENLLDLDAIATGNPD